MLSIRIVATSQMQATYARKAFPCFDEPAMKAIFDITLIHPPGTIALSNGRDAGKIHDNHGDTPNRTKRHCDMSLPLHWPHRALQFYISSVSTHDNTDSDPLMVLCGLIMSYCMP